MNRAASAPFMTFLALVKTFTNDDTYGLLRKNHSRNPKNIRNPLNLTKKQSNLLLPHVLAGPKVMNRTASAPFMTFFPGIIIFLPALTSSGTSAAPRSAAVLSAIFHNDCRNPELYWTDNNDSRSSRIFPDSTSCHTIPASQLHSVHAPGHIRAASPDQASHSSHVSQDSSAGNYSGQIPARQTGHTPYESASFPLCR